MITEAKAVRAVQCALDRCDYLTHDIKENDRTMSWDGDIFVYTTKAKKKKSDLYGVVPVQVKGHNSVFNVEAGHKEPIKYADLRNYLNHGGVMYFVVLNECISPIILYKMLLPVDIIEITEGKSEQNTISVKMEVFPLEPKEILSLLSKFIDNRKPQYPLTREDYYKSKSIFQSGNFSSFNFHPGLVEAEHNYLQILTANPQYLYFRVADLPAEFSIGKVHDIVLTEKFDCRISVKGRVYFTEATRCYRSGKIFINFGNLFSFQLNEPDFTGVGTTELKYKPMGTISERLVWDNFLLDLSKNKQFEIEGMQIQIGGVSAKSIAELEKEIQMLKKVNDVLQYLGVKNDVTFSKLPDNEANILIELAICFSENRRPAFAKKGTLIQRFVFGDTRISVLSDPEETGWPYKDFFSVSCPIAIFSDEYSEPISISPFLIVNDYEMFLCDNYDEAFVLNDIKRVKNNEATLSWKNKFLLMLLSGYDATSKKQLLDLANKVSEHLYEADHSVISQLNLFQTIRRSRKFTDSEIKDIRDILDNSEHEPKSNTTSMIACHLLLENKDQALRLLKNLSLDEREAFLSYPISSFFDSELLNRVDAL